MTTTGFGYRDRPLNFGHRGAPMAAPENTVASFQKAREAGADGVELDVQLCADGELVVIHDSSVDRTTNGRGRVRELTMGELKALDAGSWFDPQFRDERVPTLRKVVEWAGDDMLLNIELKDFSLEDNGLEQKVIALVRECEMGHRVLLSSFNPLRIWRAKRLAPGVHTGLIYEQRLPIFLRRAWLRLLARPDALHPEYKMVTEDLIVWARRKGYRINVWAPDQASEMQRLIAQKVDMIITNRPDVLSTVLREQYLQ